jgi:hypothetical protein
VGSAVAGDGTGEASPLTKSSLHTQKRNTAPYSTQVPPIFACWVHFLGPYFQLRLVYARENRLSSPR